MEKGTIVRLTDRGFGFVKTDGGDSDIFFHATELQNKDFNSLSEGDAVEFELKDGDKGPQAVNINCV